MSQHKTHHIIEAALLSAGKPLTVSQLQTLLSDDDDTPLDKQFVLSALDSLSDELSGRGVELRQVASGYRLQVRQEFEPWVARLFEERPPRYSRALLETLALIAYRQPITRAEIEDVRGVSVSSNIVKTLLEREWVKVVGQRDVPGRPSMYGTTRIFLDYFNIKSVSELPPLEQLMDLETIDKQLDMLDPDQKEDQEPAASDSNEGVETAQSDAESPDSTPTLSHDDAAQMASEGDSVPESDVPAAANEQASTETETDVVADAESGAESLVPTDSEDSDDAPAETDDTLTDFNRDAVADTGSAIVDSASEPPAELADSNGDADIDGLVHMLDELDGTPDDTASDDTAIVDVPDMQGDPESTPEMQDQVLPSELARSGDTVAAVEAARANLAEHAGRALSEIGARDSGGPSSVDTASSDLDPTDAADETLAVAPLSADGPEDDSAVPGRDPVAEGDSEAEPPSAGEPHDADIAALIDSDNRNHEAARGESVTPADSLRRSSDPTRD